jgi:urease accessory protein UreF
MQRFIAELSSLINKDAFDESWRRDCVANPNYSVAFGFVGRRISITIESALADRWGSASFQRAFSNAVRRVDHLCNVRWI